MVSDGDHGDGLLMAAECVRSIFSPPSASLNYTLTQVLKPTAVPLPSPLVGNSARAEHEPRSQKLCALNPEPAGTPCPTKAYVDGQGAAISEGALGI